MARSRRRSRSLKRRSSKSRSRRHGSCSGVRKASCNRRSSCDWVVGQGCRPSCDPCDPYGTKPWLAWYKGSSPSGAGAAGTSPAASASAAGFTGAAEAASAGAGATSLDADECKRLQEKLKELLARIRELGTEKDTWTTDKTHLETALERCNQEKVALEAAIQKRNEELQKLQSSGSIENEQRQTLIEQLKAEKALLNQAVEESNANFNRLTKKIKALERELGTANLQQNVLRRQNSALETSLAKERKKRARAGAESEEDSEGSFSDNARSTTVAASAANLSRSSAAAESSDEEEGSESSLGDFETGDDDSESAEDEEGQPEVILSQNAAQAAAAKASVTIQSAVRRFLVQQQAANKKADQFRQNRPQRNVQRALQALQNNIESERIKKAAAAQAQQAAELAAAQAAQAAELAAAQAAEAAQAAAALQAAADAAEIARVAALSETAALAAFEAPGSESGREQGVQEEKGGEAGEGAGAEAEVYFRPGSPLKTLQKDVDFLFSLRDLPSKQQGFEELPPDKQARYSALYAHYTDFKKWVDNDSQYSREEQVRHVYELTLEFDALLKTDGGVLPEFTTKKGEKILKKKGTVHWAVYDMLGAIEEVQEQIFIQIQVNGKSYKLLNQHPVGPTAYKYQSILKDILEGSDEDKKTLFAFKAGAKAQAKLAKMEHKARKLQEKMLAGKMSSAKFERKMHKLRAGYKEIQMKAKGGCY